MFKLPENINNNNIFLIGMMGSWKSTVGRKLAETLNLEFIDTDDAIEEMTEMKVAEIFREFSEQRFRERESAFFIEKAKAYGQIFSTGGGIVLQSSNRNILKNNGTTFFLEASIKILADRINNTKKRPLLDGRKYIDVQLEEIWIERKKFYEDSSHHTINTDTLSPSQVLDKVLNILELPLANY